MAVIGRPAYSLAGLTAAADATRHAVEQRAPVIYQAAMFDGRFAGFADFLVLDGDRYRLRDTKLARSVKVEALLQLAAYAETLSADGVPVHDEVELVLGNQTTARYRVDELLGVYRLRRAALQQLLDRHYAAGRRSPGPTRPSAPVCAARSANSRCAPPMTCCWSPECGSASGPG